MKKKILVGLFLTLFCISIFNVRYSYAANASAMISEVFNGTANSADAKTGVKAIIEPAAVIVKTVAVGIGVIMLTILSIKYMSAAPSEKASIKNNMIAFSLGVIMVFGAAKIVELAMSFSQNTI